MEPPKRESCIRWSLDSLGGYISIVCVQTVHACVSVCVSVCTCVWGIGWQLLGFLKTILELQEMRELKVSPETSAESCTFFVWPLDIVHVIGKWFILWIVYMLSSSELHNLTIFRQGLAILRSQCNWTKQVAALILYLTMDGEGVGGNFHEPMMIEVTRQRFEVVVVMEGTSETSNMTFQVFKSPPSQAS